jgi:hypothetical protein
MRALTKLPGYLLALTCLFQFACNDSATNQTISLEEIRPKSQKQQTKTPTKSPEDTLQRFCNFYTNDSASLQISKISLDETNDKYFLDRFSLTRQSYLLTDSLGKIFQYKNWSFKDSSACTEAFYNWLDQAGKNKGCVALKAGNIWSSNHEIYLVCERQILQISSAERMLLKNWLKWYSGTSDFKGFKYILYAQPRKKTLWLKYNNNKITAL